MTREQEETRRYLAERINHYALTAASSILEHFEAIVVFKELDDVWSFAQLPSDEGLRIVEREPKEREERMERIRALVIKLGGPDSTRTQSGESESNWYDTYAATAMLELNLAERAAELSVWEIRALGAALRLMVASGQSLPGPTSSVASSSENQRMRVEGAFWSLLEIAYVRLCAAWDRAAQLLGFVFFNYREFAYDVFPSVMDKIHANYSRYDDLFQSHDSWRRLRSYQLDESERGFKWLASRRNLVMHSVSMSRQHSARPDAEQLPSIEDHLLRRIRDRLRLRDPSVEVKLIEGHARALRDLLPHVVELCHFGAETYGLRPQRTPR